MMLNYSTLCVIYSKRSVIYQYYSCVKHAGYLISYTYGISLKLLHHI